MHRFGKCQLAGKCRVRALILACGSLTPQCLPAEPSPRPLLRSRDARGTRRSQARLPGVPRAPALGRVPAPERRSRLPPAPQEDRPAGVGSGCLRPPTPAPQGAPRAGERTFRRPRPPFGRGQRGPHSAHGRERHGERGAPRATRERGRVAPAAGAPRRSPRGDGQRAGGSGTDQAPAPTSTSSRASAGAASTGAPSSVGSRRAETI